MIPDSNCKRLSLNSSIALQFKCIFSLLNAINKDILYSLQPPFGKCFGLLIFSLIWFNVTVAQNAIVIENQNPGSPASEWDISGAGDLTIQGFATDISVNKGETVRFKIKTNASAYTIDIYRLGYYQGNGARKVGTGVITATLPQSQPADLVDFTTGLIDCGNWNESAHWVVPNTAVSGVYIAKLTRNDTRGASHIVFIVRDDASTSDLFFQTSDATWQAYNAYGGNSLYVGNVQGNPGGRAHKVSYNRPFYTRRGGGGGGAGEDWLFNAEYPMIRWLERNGFDVTYTTNVDADRRGSLIKNHKVFLSVGHDEYWSGQQRAHVEAARAAGTHLAFFSGNEVYWKTRWEPSIDGRNTDYRTLVCYKEGTMGELVCDDGKCDPLPNVWTGLWRDGCNYPNADGCNPENALTGQISWKDSDGSITVPSTYKNYRIWRNTSIQNLQNGQSTTFPNGTIGYEWNYEQDNGKYPPGRVTLSEANVDGSIHKLSLYRHSSGALVFGAGTVQWSWGLDANHDRSGTPVDSRMQQATVNLFADMGVLPGSLQSGLIASVPSNDLQSPVTVISAPQNGGTILPNAPITITGTATESGGIIVGVEVSTDGGATWKLATGTTNWTYTWTPTTNGSYTIKSRAVDDLGNLERTTTATNTIQVSTNSTVCDTPPTATLVATASNCQSSNVSLQLSEATGQAPYTVVVNNQTYSNVVVGQPFATLSSAEVSIWGNTGTPANANDYDGQSIEVGVKFRASQSGTITGIRFYKGTSNTGTHVGNLWTVTGTLLASATFQNETASGWQEVRFATPVSIQANTTYVASYFSASGRYASSANYFSSNGVTNGPLTALQDGVQGGNGLYRYGASGFPSSSFSASNYWVDVLFKPMAATTYTLTSITDSRGCNNTGTISSATVTTSGGQTSSQTYYEDADGDGYGNAAKTIIDCVVPAGYVAQAGDCNDNDAAVRPGATEVCDGKDNNCDGVVDEGCNVPPPPPPPPPPTDGPSNGPGGPILVVSSTSNPFSRYFAEILRAEGLNAFAVKDITQVTETELANYEVVILGEMSLSASHVTLFTNWVNAGGTLIAMRPDAQLSGLMGITPISGTLADKYLLVNTTTIQGKGIVGQTMQYHGPANLYTLNGATMLARLYSSATAATNNPAVTIRDVGTNGGQAIAFAYDLARSIVYTRQGNPAWAGQERDNRSPIRSNDQYYGAANFDPQADYVDLNKVAIPQADEQQHLLANLILHGNMDKKPLPRFWFLPRGLKAAIVMTGDDHANGGTAARFQQYKNLSPSNSLEAVKNWQAIRGTSYIYPNSPLTNTQAQSFRADSFEVSLHLNTSCSDWTASSLQDFYTDQLQQFANRYTSIGTPLTHRIHCLIWSDWSSGPKVERTKGGRLNATYYYWPGEWLQNRAGMFTGSGMPMRFADLDGTIIDNYQLTTQMTDESDQDYPDFVDALLDKALGPEGYYGVFCANMHTDAEVSTGSDAIISSALARNVPVISAQQMLTWLDARNGSSFSSFNWSNDTLRFSITAMTSAHNLEGMLPVDVGALRFVNVRFNGSLLTTRVETIKGIQYIFFPAVSGNYIAVYSTEGCRPPTATLVATAEDCQMNTISLKLSAATGQAPYSIVVNNQTYSNVVVGQPFATVTASESSIWNNVSTPANPNLNDGQGIEVGVKFRASQSGTITGIRFYKGTSNTGTHIGHLWTASGTLLASATFQNETASGWQEVRFTTPVSIQANTTYVASYYSPDGGYSITGGYFNSSTTSGPLTALQSGLDGENGVYRYGASGFPSSSFNATNYWVDVLFKSSAPTSYTLTNITDSQGCNNTGSISTATATINSQDNNIQTFYRDADGDGYGNATISTTACTMPTGYVTNKTDCQDSSATVYPGATEVCDGKDNNCDGVVDEGCNVYYRDFDNDGFGNAKDSITGLTLPTGYVTNKTDCQDSSATVYPGALEVCGNSIDDNCDGRVDESCVVATTEYSIWGNTGTPANPNDNDGRGIVVGVKFRASQSGTITGIRFYKGTSNTGTHIGHLWTASGTLLASATFQNETASGWQEVRFATPVSIQANTTYVASYYSSLGRYASTERFFANSGLTNGPLTALQNGVQGSNGVYRYGTNVFPNSSFRSSNYWVDVLFKPNQVAPVTMAIKSNDPLVIEQESLSLQAVPNPSSSYFTLHLKGSDQSAIDISVIDVVGKVVERKSGLIANSYIEIGRNYRPGIYFVRARQGKNEVTIKLVKLSH